MVKIHVFVLFARHSSLFSECLHSVLMPDRSQVVNMSSFIPNDTPTLLMTHSTNPALDLPLLDSGPAQLFLMRENCQRECYEFAMREALCAPNSHVCVCFRKAGALLRCASEPRITWNGNVTLLAGTQRAVMADIIQTEGEVL